MYTSQSTSFILKILIALFEIVQSVINEEADDGDDDNHSIEEETEVTNEDNEQEENETASAREEEFTGASNNDASSGDEENDRRHSDDTDSEARTRQTASARVSVDTEKILAHFTHLSDVTYKCNICKVSLYNYLFTYVTNYIE